VSGPSPVVLVHGGTPAHRRALRARLATEGVVVRLSSSLPEAAKARAPGDVRLLVQLDGDADALPDGLGEPRLFIPVGDTSEPSIDAIAAQVREALRDDRRRARPDAQPASSA
jgi:NAD(P)-dependent dehydrogenase (short-subunit alcohol dehydrogenase family)